MNIHFVFCHGWGFDRTFLEPLYTRFSVYPMTIWDAGYFSERSMPAPPLNVPLVGIGHSFGMMQLMNSGLSFHALIGLQSLIHFFGHQSAVAWIRKKAWQAMHFSFQKNPEWVLEQFYQRCETKAPLSFKQHTLNIQPLTDDLEKLTHPTTLPNYPFLVLGTTGDKLAPPRLLQDNFGDNVRLLEASGHHLGHTHSEWVAREIFDFLNTCK